MTRTSSVHFPHHQNNIAYSSFQIRLLQYKEDGRNGKQLTDEQVQALSRISEVETQIEFVKDILKILTSLHKDFNRSKKQRDEALRREVYTVIYCGRQKLINATSLMIIRLFLSFFNFALLPSVILL